LLCKIDGQGGREEISCHDSLCNSTDLRQVRVESGMLCTLGASYRFLSVVRSDIWEGARY